MHLFMILLASGLATTPVLAAPIERQTSIESRWTTASPAITSKGDEEPTDAVDTIAVKSRWVASSPAITSKGDEGPVADSEATE
ncbi:hypothetical protein CkaCkLH20_00830 [Colletotrichum karsti]|uniref:Secreted protein n=1 Tax=Colletotrichum karsti TaxID=1095194 RepID=A0A9P6LMN3_9PEZI|nr:uncharacterized protein CkaCkLH20_00830 [Colletotrichum karsti]KAF9881684.1 hypothetical protein CkaCkLH20_00830 [Colletotrichum karsti]